MEATGQTEPVNQPQGCTGCADRAWEAGKGYMCGRFVIPAISRCGCYETNSDRATRLHHAQSEPAPAAPAEPAQAPEQPAEKPFAIVMRPEDAFGTALPQEVAFKVAEYTMAASMLAAARHEPRTVPPIYIFPDRPDAKLLAEVFDPERHFATSTDVLPAGWLLTAFDIPGREAVDEKGTTLPAIVMVIGPWWKEGCRPEGEDDDSDKVLVAAVVAMGFSAAMDAAKAKAEIITLAHEVAAQASSLAELCFEQGSAVQLVPTAQVLGERAASLTNAVMGMIDKVKLLTRVRYTTANVMEPRQPEPSNS